jgi:hypothetical protein
MTLDQVRAFALSLPATTEEPHFDRTSFRVRGRIFVTARPGEGYIHVFIGERHREPALALHDRHVEKLVWGGKATGLRVRLARAPVALVRELVHAAWAERAPKALLKAAAD